VVSPLLGYLQELKFFGDRALPELVNEEGRDRRIKILLLTLLLCVDFCWVRTD
jgi:hypothetical protein